MSGNPHRLYRVLQNHGTANWTGNQLRLQNGRFENNGSFTANSSGSLVCVNDGGFNAFTNAGTFTKLGMGEVQFSNPFNNTGLVDVQDGTLRFNSGFTQFDGETILSGGALAGTSTLQFQGGVLAGAGTITANVISSATVQPGASPGQLSISGNYTQTTNGVLFVELAGLTPVTEFDRLAVSGTATLAGTLVTTLTNDFYPPADADFTFLTAGTRSGNFATFLYPSNAVGMELAYTSTNAAINVINVRPVITPIVTQVTNELEEFILLAAATDDDTPAQTLTWELVSGPSGLGIGSEGLVTWIPGEEQGPGTNNVVIKVTDNGTPNLAVTNSFELVVNEINAPPMPTGPGNQVIDEFGMLDIAATATDPDIPTNSVVWELVSGPAGLIVATNGVITWITDETHGSNVFNVAIRVTDNNPDAVNTQQLSATNEFLVTVNEVNVAPVLTVPTNQTLVEETLLSVSALATDADLPANGLAFSLLNPPAGMTIDPGTGLIEWTPSEVQGPTNFVVTVVVTDSSPFAVNAVNLSDTNTFMVSVLESNQPPVLTVPVDQHVDEETLLSVAAQASDPDEPANPLSFALVNPPAGMTIHPTSGLIEWIPTEEQGPINVIVTVVATDDNPDAIGENQLSTTNSFEVSVSEVNLPPVITLPEDGTYHAGVAVALYATGADADLPANALHYELVSGPEGLSVDAAGLITWNPEVDQIGTNEVTVRVVDDGDPILGDTNSFNLIIVGLPVPDLPVIAGTNVILSWTAVAGTDYSVQYKGNLSEPAWTALPVVITATNDTASTVETLTVSNRLYRVEVLTGE